MLRRHFLTILFLRSVCACALLWANSSQAQNNASTVTEPASSATAPSTQDTAATNTPAAPITGGAPTASAQPARTTAATPPETPHKPAPDALIKPLWKQLSPSQQAALLPLAERWDVLDLLRKRKWLEIAKQYHSLPPAEQDKVHERMTEWVNLNNQQRAQARLNYVETRKLSAEEKALQWQVYQELSKDEKRRLAAHAPVKLGVASSKPTSPEKMPPVPTAHKGTRPVIPVKNSDEAIDRNTLLPKQLREPLAAPSRLGR